MNLFNRNNYLSSPEGLLAQYRSRLQRRIRFGIEDIEPRAKNSMSVRDKDEVQRQLLDYMVRLHRRAFRGPLALRLILSTTSKNPTQSHNVTKNLLDLFAAPRPNLLTGRSRLLYKDDSQIHALSVTCHHGQTAPLILGMAMPLRSFLKDLEIASTHSERVDDERARDELDEEDTVLEEFKRLRRSEPELRQRYGNRPYKSLVRYARERAQEMVLRRTRITLQELSEIYGVAHPGIGQDLSTSWEQMVATWPMRVSFSELPQTHGDSSAWRNEIEAKLEAFQTRFGWLLDPLLVPVALEVVIKPSPPSRNRGLHDLDNVLRTHLIPRVFEILKPLSHGSFTLDIDALNREMPHLFARSALADWPAGLPPPPPESTRTGVTRYEVWRLPPAKEGSIGFVTITLVRDWSGGGDVFGQIDDEFDAWQESLRR